MSSSENDLSERVSFLERYTNTLHMVLEHFVQRLRKVEEVTGKDEEGIAGSLEWRGQIEATLTRLMSEQDWHWQESTDPAQRTIGDVAYKQILRLSEMLPIDVLTQLWARTETPEDLPLVWSEPIKAPPTEQETNSDPFKDQSDKKLMKKIEEIGEL